MQLITDILTGKDGESYDIARVLLLAFGIAFITFTAYDLFINRHFDTSNFGLNAGAILGGGGVGIGMKAKTEPDA